MMSATEFKLQGEPEDELELELAPPKSTGAGSLVLRMSPLAVKSPRGWRTVGGKRSRPVWGIVVHTTGSGPATMARKPNRWNCKTPIECALALYGPGGIEGFPHYVIGYDGSIYSVSPEDYVAWHAGWTKAIGGRAIWLHWKQPAWWSKVWGTGSTPLDLVPKDAASPNTRHMGIELLGNATNGLFTDAQYNGLARLVVDIERRHRLDLGQPPNPRLLGHEDVNPLTGKGGRADAQGGWDPGAHRRDPRFSWKRLAELMRGARAAAHEVEWPETRMGEFEQPYRPGPWHLEYNPPGFEERSESWRLRNREVEFESELDLEEELEDEAAELNLVFPPWPSQYLGRDSGSESLVSESELEHRPQVKPGPQMRRRPVAQPRKPVGNLLIPFTSRAISKYRGRDGKLQSTLCAVCVPNAAWRQTAVDLLVFFHGDQIDSPGPCKHDFDPEKVILNFLLDVQLDRSGRKVALAVPVIHWRKGETGYSENFGGKWRAETLNKFVEEVLDEIGKQSGVKPTLGRLIIAGHSHAYAILNPLAREFNRGPPATREGASAKLSGVWALDSTYGKDGTSARALDSWARALPGGRFIAVLNRQSGGPIDGWRAYLNAFPRGAGPPPNLRMCSVEETHCVIPTKYIGQLLSARSYPPSWCVS